MLTRRFFTIIRHKKIMKMDISTKEPENSIREGKAEVLLKNQKVFYNPVQQFNRDLSVAVLTVFCEDFINEKVSRAQAKARTKAGNSDITIEECTKPDKVDISILEALSATGLRSFRYAKEVPNITRIVANDLSEQAVQTIKDNIVHNGVEGLVETSHDDACMVMYRHKHPTKRFSAIDLDPYGCPSIFLDSAVQSVEDGGLLLVTATDMAVLAGNSPETCYSKYGAISLKTKCCHEMALRILLQCIEQHANRYGRYIVPLLSISADFYIRVFVKVYTGALQCKQTTSKLSMVYSCVGCGQITLQPLGGFKPNPTEKRPDQTKAFLPTGPPVKENCEHCNQRHHMGGPIWSAPIHDETFVTRILQNDLTKLGTVSRIRGVLSMVREELETPLYYTMDKLVGTVHSETMPMLVMRSALLNSGYKVSFSHAAKNSIKTNAPPRLVWDVVRTWVATHPVKPEKLEKDPVARHILSQDTQYTVDMNLRPDADPPSRREGALRFQYNPTPYWGPGSRAAINVGDEKMSKSVKNQNKYTKRGDKGKRPHSPPSGAEAHKKPANE